MSIKFILIGLIPAFLAPVKGDNEQATVTPVFPLAYPVLRDETFDWKPALSQSMRFLFVEHGFRILMQPRTSVLSCA